MKYSYSYRVPIDHGFIADLFYMVASAALFMWFFLEVGSSVCMPSNDFYILDCFPLWVLFLVVAHYGYK